MTRATELLARAAEAARTGMADGRGGPFGAVVAQGDLIISVGTNRVVRDQDPTAHAEICAVRDACKTLNTHVLSGCDIYSTCEPCPMCLSAIFWARIDRIYFAADRSDAAAAGFDDAAIYREVSVDLAHRTIPVIRADSPESVRLFDEWRAMTDKIRY